jgi:NADPH:quinone reductase-like Zn-dependent oxidoreductase
VNGLAPTIAATYPASELPAALDHLARGAFGKVVVTF